MLGLSAEEFLEDVPADTPLNPEDALIRRHKREKKELQGQILAMKKALAKSDKKKKKELLEEIQRKETALESRHRAELETLNALKGGQGQKNNGQGSAEIITQKIKDKDKPEQKLETSDSLTSETLVEGSNNTNSEASTPCPGTPRMSKARKRRDKKEAEDRERQRRIEAETQVLVQNSDRTKEDEDLTKLLSDLKLSVHDIPPDGDCLYSSVSHQMKLATGNDLPVDELRAKTASFLRDHKADFIHYFDERISGSDAAFEKYCEDLETTPAWGGQVEVQILSQVLQRPIRVVQRDGPTLVYGENLGGPPLNLTYHRHKFQLGAHYNSAVPLQPSP